MQSSSRLFISLFAIPAVFTPSDNKELDQVLEQIQYTIIFPALLPTKQQKIIFDPSKREYMEENPVVIEVENQEFRLRPLDRLKGIENANTLFVKALCKMETPKDWSNMATLLAGYKKAHVVLRKSHWGQMVRRASSSGNMQAVIECIKQWNETVFMMASHEVACRLFAGNNERIYRDDADLKKTRRVWAQSEMLMDLLNRPEHSLKVKDPRDRLFNFRLIRGMHLYAMCSAINANKQAGEDIDKDMGILRDEVARIMSMWEANMLDRIEELPELKLLNPSVERYGGLKFRGPKVTKALNGYMFVTVLAQNIRAMELAMELVGDDARYLQQVQDAIEKYMGEFTRTAIKARPTWKDQYETITGRRPNWPAWVGEAELIEAKKARIKAAAAALKAAAEGTTVLKADEGKESTGETGEAHLEDAADEGKKIEQ
ncbi:hypothetical protein CDD80_5792 [Ophiocordyceps camponoti-rufipedis]|uniref:Uncharacterized protein n=1 Tax=Ophiocordyceps camponoti-rufipedis TaxID=2004952 RepID=A0A2C5YUJ5_9HYPO|nr:hypothetical protein CDD80_5792 [Ophiocordyceps camponoti-rufipedis]